MADDASLKAQLNALAASELELLASGVPVHSLFAQRSALIDAVLRQTWHSLGLDDAQACLVAVGGYGRGELFPYSDIDVLILLPDEAHAQAGMESFIARLWDLGLHLGHATRSIAACVTLAAEDLNTLTSLLEARVLCGDATLWHDLHARLFADDSTIWPAPAFFRGKQAEQDARHRRYDESAYKIEPNIKESPGGLRDWHTLRWLLARLFPHTPFDPTAQVLVSEGLLTEREHQDLLQHIEFLSRLRYTLHLLTERHEDRLLLPHQKALAARCERHTPLHENDSSNAQVEAFMRRYFRAVLTLSRINALVMQQIEERLFPPQGEVIAINPRFNRRGHLIESADAQLFLRTPSAMLELFLLVQQSEEPLTIRASTLRQLQSHVHLLRSEMRDKPATRALFLSILRQPRGVFDALKHMNALGVLAACVPDFDHIVGRMQFDLFHLYTVDAHTLLVIRNQRRFSTPQGQKENPLAHAIFARFDKPELLYLAALFHDIAKGMGGEHEILGAEKAHAFCTQLALPAADVALVTWLVREHLHLSFVAQRRDLDDPSVIEEFARWIGTAYKLDALYLLTVADIHATNPNLWTDWRAALLRELYQKTRHTLEHGQQRIDTQTQRTRVLEQLAHACPPQDGAAWQTAHGLLDTLPARYLLRHTPKALAWRLCGMLHTQNNLWLGLHIDEEWRISELFVYCQDQPNLFAHLAATLDRLGLNIQSAYLTSTCDGKVVDDIYFLDAQGEPLRDPWLQDDLLHQLARALQHPTTTQHSQRRASPLLRHFACPTEIDMQTSARGETTEVSLQTRDRPGLLALIGSVLAELHFDLRGATINTLGEKAQDTLYVTVNDAQGQAQPLSAKQRALLEQHLRQALTHE